MTYFTAKTKNKTYLMKLSPLQHKMLLEEKNGQCSHLDLFPVIGTDETLYADEIIELKDATSLFSTLRQSISRTTLCKKCMTPVIVATNEEPSCPCCHNLITSASAINADIKIYQIEKAVAHIIMNQK